MPSVAKLFWRESKKEKSRKISSFKELKSPGTLLLMNTPLFGEVVGVLLWVDEIEKYSCYDTSDPEKKRFRFEVLGGDRTKIFACDRRETGEEKIKEYTIALPMGVMTVEENTDVDEWNAEIIYSGHPLYSYKKYWTGRLQGLFFYLLKLTYRE